MSFHVDNSWLRRKDHGKREHLVASEATAVVVDLRDVGPCIAVPIGVA